MLSIYHGCELTLSSSVDSSKTPSGLNRTATASTQTKSAGSRLENLDFRLVCAFGIGNAIAPEFHSQGLVPGVSLANVALSANDLRANVS
ncbi:hypothetical protein [Coleofasciculus sp. FACHB-1120]|uniref:hypothetical protein n=1 Tax=Coleofasciculus sp. FACHB-1120 TaxID=2692783 RepID=UPI0016835734|nr:hypothetical protein [Coleofasciculus sp. FACHB-1120]MBD2742982.1 hypothetical protein [Coleofasciculus sp. FACHB-1120]